MDPYGEPLQQVKPSSRDFASSQLSKRNRNMALYSYPEGLLGKPSNQSSIVAQQTKQIVPIGFSLLQVELKRAKEHLKGRSGIIVLLSDGHITHLEEVRKVIASIHKMGCTLFVIGVGQDRDEDTLKSLCVHPQFYRTADRDLDISKHLIKLLKHT